MSQNHEQTKLRPLTKKEKMVLTFIENFMKEQELSPSYQEIQEHFGFRSISSVQSYLRQLKNKGYIHSPGNNQKRALSILHSTQTLFSPLGVNSQSRPLAMGRLSSFSRQNISEQNDLSFGTQSLSIPLLGLVAAGKPIEALHDNEFIEVPFNMVRHPHKTFALRVEGQSMIEDGILDGDFILVQQQSQANNGDITVAIIDNEATVKRFYLHNSGGQQFIHPFPQSSSQSHLSTSQRVELRPANAGMDSMWFRPEQVEIRGLVVGLIRHY
ncbi:MAG: transcriptional repressor LexA [Bdellovibrionales bacterium]|nr:transcriptional repressor LexA [Bdellovibrionales bacterium]